MMRFWRSDFRRYWYSSSRIPSPISHYQGWILSFPFFQLSLFVSQMYMLPMFPITLYTITCHHKEKKMNRPNLLTHYHKFNENFSLSKYMQQPNKFVEFEEIQGKTLMVMMYMNEWMNEWLEVRQNAYGRKTTFLCYLFSLIISLGKNKFYLKSQN